MIKRGKQRTEIVTGIDIGSTAIRIVVGQHSIQMDGSEELQIIGASEVPSEGVQKGVVTSIEETVSSISNGLEQIERHIGIPVDHAWIGISGTHIMCQESKGVVAVAKTNGEITEEDIDRAVDAARTVATPLNFEILHVIPRHFAVDGQTGIKDPVGMTGIRLEVDAQMIYGATGHIKNITKAVYRTGIDIDDLVFSILATSDAVTTPRQKELGVAVVNIGGATTSVVVYAEGDIIHSAVLPIGSAHITNDLAIGLRTAIDTAEQVKIEFGQCISKGISKKEKVKVKDKNTGNEEVLSLQYIAEIIEARAAEILHKIDEELQKAQCSGLLPAGVIFTGGGSKVIGLVDLAKRELQLPAALGYPVNMQSITDKVNDISFATAIGLVKWGSGTRKISTKARAIRGLSAGKVAEQVQKLFKTLIP